MLVDRTAYIISLAQVLTGATALMILLPLYVWRNYLKDKSYTYRFVFIILVQNSILINLVLLLGFFGILNKAMVLLGMLAVYVPISWHFSDKGFFRRSKNLFSELAKLIYGKKHFFTLKREIRQWLLTSWKKLKSWSLWQHIWRNLPEYILLITAVAYNIWFLSHNVLDFHSYQFSDIPVHQKWIYALSKGKLFDDGIYPFGMHIIVYLIHDLFLIDLREVLLYFGIFQVIILILSLHIFARRIFRWKYGAFIVTIYFSLTMRQGRYSAALPQECGVFALVLAGWCLVQFLKRPLKKHTIEGDTKIRGLFRFKQYLGKDYLNIHLILFALAVALTISYHFYTAIGALVLVVSFFIAYIFRMVKKQYWIPIVMAGILGVTIAVGPFMACYTKGMPFQESMAWAMSVIRGEEWLGSESEYKDKLEETLEEKSEGIVEEDDEWTIEIDEKEQETLIGKIKIYYQAIYEFFRVVMVGDRLINIFVISLAVGAILSIFLIIAKQTRLIGAGYLTIGLYLAIMGLLGAARALDIMEIIGSSRAMTFAEPFLALVYVIPLDFIFRILLLYKNKIYQFFLHLISMGLCIGLIYIIFSRGLVHDFFDVNLAYYNEPDILVKEIRKTYKPETFTIVSTVEEYYQVIDYGYHENLSKFINMASGNEEEYKIPTQYVFFFIEKKVLDDYYYGSIDVSLELAHKDFVYFASSQDYYFQRAVLESKAYYWALEFHKMYPRTFKVYFENDIYIAYILEQNPYNLYNFQIDYLPRK